MIEWLSSLKTVISNATAYELLVANVQLLIEAREAYKALAEVSTAEAKRLAAELDQSRSRLAELEQENACLHEADAERRARIKFDVFQGLAFERRDQDAKHDPNPHCPNCLSFMSGSPRRMNQPYVCPKCGYRVDPGSTVNDLVHLKKGNQMPIPDPKTIHGKQVVITHRFDKHQRYGSEEMDPDFYRGVVLRVDSGGLLVGDGTNSWFFSFTEIGRVQIQ